jgi:hypothetical protein
MESEGGFQMTPLPFCVAVFAGLSSSRGAHPLTESNCI